MSESSLKSFHLKQPDGDEVERSIEFLDKVLSEFEDPDSLPHIEQEPETPTQGNQSEDDGYMSMNGKKELKLINIESDNNLKNKRSFGDVKLRNDCPGSVVDAESIPCQTTLPKARPINVNPSKYASLPGSMQPKNNVKSNDSDFLMTNGRTKLGIDISAVHDAVLRGVARLPEVTMEKEHPITIYPGRSSPVKPKSSTNRKVVRSTHDLTDKKLKLHLNDESSDGEEEEEYEEEGITQADSPSEDFKPLQQIVSLSHFDNRHSLITSEEDFSDDSLENGHAERDTFTQIIEIKVETKEIEQDDDITPPPPPPPEHIPLMLPLKCEPGIAWEIKMDDSVTMDKLVKLPSAPAIPPIFADCENSVASTPCNSILSTDHSFSSDWPDPPENPICSTEDEAGSIITDSEDVVPLQVNTIPNGTYVIRKGRDRKQVFDIPEFVPSNETERESEIKSILESSQELLSIEEANDIPQPPINIPKYRHSIDLALPSMQSSIHSAKSDYNSFWSKPNDGQMMHANSLTPSKSKQDYLKDNKGGSSNKIDVNDDLNAPLMRVASLPIINAPAPVNQVVDLVSTPRRDLAPPIEEDEEPESESQGNGVPLRQIENNISALLRGEISVRVPDIQAPRRPLGFRAGVHKSESAKEMLLSQHIFGALPPSPPSSSADEIDGFPPLPPLPTESNADVYENKIWPDSHSYRSTSLGKKYRDSIESAPPVPPHRCPSTENTLKTMSMDSKHYKSSNIFMSPHTTNSTHSHDRMALSNSRKRMPGAYIKHTTPSPHEERRLQTSCSLPETPIFARGCDVPRTPHRRTQEMPSGGSRTAPRPMNSLNSSIVGIAGSTLNGRQPQRNINHALLSSEMLRIAGGPARGWYPKQRQNRPVSNENLDRIHCGRAWDAGTSSRKPLTLPPNLSPNFFKKSPTDALRRVTSLLIRKGEKGKDSDKKEKNAQIPSAHRSFDAGTMEYNTTPNTHKKKGFFKSFWKKNQALFHRTIK